MTMHLIEMSDRAVRSRVTVFKLHCNCYSLVLIKSIVISEVRPHLSWHGRHMAGNKPCCTPCIAGL